jgi:superfamily II DNA or RNA helicase
MFQQGKMAVLMGMAAEALRCFLDRSLPQLRVTWWQDLVLPSLSFQQRRMVDQQGVKTLAKLDLAALLRVLDQNWHSVSQARNLPGSDRNYVKEMFTVRNRWAHVSTLGISEEDLYRDLDTLQRFGVVIEGTTEFIDAIKTAKVEVRQPVPAQQAHVPECRPQVTTEFTVGEIVTLKSNPTVTGAVIAAIPTQPENRYTVFHDGTTTTYYASQLVLTKPGQTKIAWLTFPEFHAGLSALQICHPSLSTLFSLNAARVDFVPYQYRPVLKFIRADRPRLLIADGVGVGKTIEAGLILRELQARGDVRKILIICPKPLVVERKWELEMKRFDERFTHLDGSTLRYCIDEMNLEGEWSEQHSRAIIPYSLLDGSLLHGESNGKKRRKGLLDLDPPPRFDLVVVDEAHRIRNTDTYTYEGVRFFCDNAEAVLFLTATPLQLGSEDLFVLLNVLRPDLIIDRESYDHMAAPNPSINHAVGAVRSQQEGWQRQAREALSEAAATGWGKTFLAAHPEFQRAFDLLGNNTSSAEERVDLINSLEQMHTFSGIINRTRRRDIGQFTIRRPETVQVDFTPQQRELHDEILRVQAVILTRLHGDRSVKFLMTTIRRQAASCLFGLVPLLKVILTRRLDELVLGEPDEFPDEVDGVVVGSIEADIASVLDKATHLPPEDPKLLGLIKIVNDKQRLGNNKVMVFSTFRHTLSYLLDKTQSCEWRVGMIHGGVLDEERVSLRDRFRLPKEESDALDVLLFSEIGCEGLDYEFCDCIVNYDLPWNPMRVEQRIGRIDRRGQQSEHVTIYNMVTPGTVDAEIYQRCLLRIGVFNREIGASEEILGQITREIRDIAENLSLTPDEQAEKLQQIADNQIRLIRQQEELEDRQYEFFGLRLPERRTQSDIDNATSFWLSPLAIQNLVERYLTRTCGETLDYILGEKRLKTLRLSQDARDRMLKDFRKLPRQKAVTYRKWEDWLKGTDPHLAITFDAACAVDHPEAMLVTLLHPVVRQAADAIKTDQPLFMACTISDDSLPFGDHPFAIHQWQLHGLRDDVELRAVSTNGPVADRLMELLAGGAAAATDNANEPAVQIRDALEAQHYSLWLCARNQHRDRILQLAQYRRESLCASHAARIALLREQLTRANEEKIRRMRLSQIANAEADFGRRIKELDDSIGRADITTKLVAYGILKVGHGVKATS